MSKVWCFLRWIIKFTYLHDRLCVCCKIFQRFYEPFKLRIRYKPPFWFSSMTLILLFQKQPSDDCNYVTVVFYNYAQLWKWISSDCFLSNYFTCWSTINGFLHIANNCTNNNADVLITVPSNHTRQKHGKININ